MAEETVSCPVKIHMVTEFFQEEELVLFGRYYEKGGAAYLKYNEMQETGEIHTVVKVGGEKALILRSGTVSMRLDLRPGEKRPGSYGSGYGTFPLEVMADDVAHRRTGYMHGQFSLGYRLFIQERQVGTYKMTIHYEEVQEAK
ncbi:hypothetical protein BpJC4_08110 [Weizmannia acidilactici]|uniref:DUF1934 domain-containing protein n=1 Tax=Weizmannia acidilactici TaxID=2607726 RepID=UPI00124C012C|nr:DUF1934 domain-containing protein [Weizmannia acidilactici]GER66340.1 hypothetical protein BpJC4_08110 [Weizmannia acidilactici]